MANTFSPKLLGPSLSEGSHKDLSLESTLQDLPLYQFQVKSSCLAVVVAEIFEQNRLIPGAVLIEAGKLVGMISRRQLLEYLLKPQGPELFLHLPLKVLYSYARVEILLLAESTTILAAAQQALRRSPELQSEPIVVQIDTQSYRLLDPHALNIAYWQIRGIETQVRYERAQTQMIQSEKMASLGRLVTGVAHEILDPVSFIWGNLTYISEYSKNLMQLLSVYDAHCTNPPPEIAQLKEDIDYDFLQNDFLRTVTSIKAGAERLSKLASSLQNFCHIDDVYPKPADLHANIDSILLLLKSRLSGEIRVIKNYGYLPPVPCYAGQLNQVFMNILTNSINTLINEAVGQEFAKEFKGGAIKNFERQPQIEITTQVCCLEPASDLDKLHLRWVSIRITDNGPGMSPNKYNKILESFSTEKRALKETSLAVSYQIVTGKHGGAFRMRSQLGTGTEFEILLPLA
ncbi:MAG: sensor histidine kinase [Microcoleus sp. PH2017_10_PVI_O_A]|uniref:sensor histidine kinase n=1 Tax=unclassified Microcoleus TaxID=2642155 RepID=UPI001DBF3DC3|nr:MULTISPECIES: ATP-binding protein [unclassified Microcoleus]TAE84749.1 MAG: sensor histidine kinase [Oscillatoriales cyanobacterium]MCC3405010.1 sensor histidine kinase [Microcoleus sp. PH2017_10_PVI_O_A]MCC3458969.1 sensor histidine kinase [Microcoleus sp. PH2017_11_PCY_U_A]MCC3477802.1 sensor histidine kinase [Microcoleus sp. PH2017_12_PCY_D_A]MCC3527745.1 sensor histidine kinase [Microcoleus sp. PH2017_21_RUC_O_A]